MFNLTSKNALVTGAGSGIGAAIAEAFAKAGAHVVVTDIDGEAAKATAKHIQSGAGRAEARRLDVANAREVELTAEELEQSTPIHIVVNNAGIGHVGTILQTTASDLQRLFQVNVEGIFNVSRAFLKPMLERREGVFVNMASIGGVVGVRDRLAYCTTKFAVVGLTKSMALDHALMGIRVNCICPGRVETPFVAARLKEYPDPARAYQEMAATQALGRMGRPEEIAAAALYLASDEAAFVTGSALVIDGGWSAGK